MILAGDIGGTKTHLALFTQDGRRMRIDTQTSFASREHESLAEICRKFLSGRQLEIRDACFGVAGPVRQGVVKTTNLAWVVDAGELSKTLGIERVTLVNDMEANALGIAALEPQDFVTLQAGEPDPKGQAVVLSAGTGLGEAGLVWDGKFHRAVASEGGHASFSPRTDQQIELLKFLRRELEHVSYERVLSGPGLFNIYRFLKETGRAEEPRWLTDEIKAGDPAAAITRAALDKKSPVCVAALDLFIEIYGDEAGNLALKMMATAGVYVGGGIAPKIASRMGDGRFLRSFLAKGRMQRVLEKMPVRVILNDRTALLGAGRAAAMTAGRL